MNLVYNLKKNKCILKSELMDCEDVVFRDIAIDGGKSFCIIYAAQMVDKQLLTTNILKPIIHGELSSESIKDVIPSGQVEESSLIEECTCKIFNGAAVVLIDNEDYAIIIDGISGYKNRSIMPSEAEPTVKGPKDSFTESLFTNMSLVRKRLLNKHCKCKIMKMGKYTQNSTAVMYIDAIANAKMVDEVFRRLNAVKNEEILSGNYIEEFIADSPNSLYPTALISDRPDRVVASLLDGRVAILQDNNPDAVIVPSIFIDFFKTPDDYYEKYWVSTLFRFIRYMGFLVTIFLPSIYIAVTTFNQELLPTSLIITLAKQRDGVPLPASLETFLMYVSFLAIREAGTRLPRGVGETVSIVGGIIVGDASVRAGLVSPAVVVITALTGITSFLTPSTQLTSVTGYLKFISLIASSFIGIWGIFLVFIINMGHIEYLRSFGVPYMSPVSPLVIEDLDDLLFRAPVWELTNKPFFLFSNKYKSHIEHMSKMKK